MLTWLCWQSHISRQRFFCNLVHEARENYKRIKNTRTIGKTTKINMLEKVKVVNSNVKEFKDKSPFRFDML